MDRSEKTVMNFFQKLHDSLKTEIADVIKENMELRRRLEFTQDKLDELLRSSGDTKQNLDN